MYEKNLAEVESPDLMPALIPGQRSDEPKADVRPSFNFVLIHGAWHSKDSWAPLQAELEYLGHGTMAPNLPIDNPNACFADDAQVINKSMVGLANVFLVGHSRGGEIIPRVLANIALTDIVGVATINSGGPHDFDASKLSLDESLDRYSEEFKSGIVISDSGMSTYDKDRAAKIFYHDVEDKAFLDLALKSLRPQRDVTKEIERIPEFPTEIPVFSLFGTDDRVHNSERARRITAKWLNSKIIDFPSGHTPQLSNPAELASLLVDLAEESSIIRLP